MQSVSARPVVRPASPDAPAAPKPEGDIFARSRFFLRQKHFSISEKYFVWSEDEKKLLFVERPAHAIRRLAAPIMGALAGVLVAGLMVALSAALIVFVGLPEGTKDATAVIALLTGLAAAAITIVALVPKRHVTFYRDETKKEPVLRVEQDSKFQPITVTYTVKDPAGAVLARLSKNYLYNAIRKRWYCDDVEGRRICTIKEDSIILSIGRRLLGPMLGILRTNFIFLSGDNKQIGKFDRKFTLFDRYVLDVTADTSGILDRRVALAVGVMLDTGEKR